MVDDLKFARDVLNMVVIGIQAGHIRARDVEFLYSDGPKRVSVQQLAADAARKLEREVAALGEKPRFPTMLRKMWSGREVQAWIDANWPAGVGGTDGR